MSVTLMLDFDDYGSNYQMNVANGNFSTIFSALGFDIDWYGEMEPNKMLNALIRTPKESMLRADQQFAPNHFSCGINIERAESYYSRLKRIALEAKRRNVNIVWC